MPGTGILQTNGFSVFDLISIRFAWRSSASSITDYSLSEEFGNLNIDYSATINEEFLNWSSLKGGKSNEEVKKLQDLAAKENSKVFVISAKIEEELVGMSTEEKNEFLNDLGIKESGLSKLISASYDLLDLMSFLTAGEKEVRAWTIKKGTIAPKAAGKIHTDFEKGFIRAEVVKYDDLISLGSYNTCKEKGLVRMEGKTYVVEDGDIIVFHFND